MKVYQFELPEKKDLKETPGFSESWLDTQNIPVYAYIPPTCSVSSITMELEC